VLRAPPPTHAKLTRCLRIIDNSISNHYAATGGSAPVLISGEYRSVQEQLQASPAGWLPKFMERFELIIFNRIKCGFRVVGEHTAG
jgi:hypothetical protein